MEHKPEIEIRDLINSGKLDIEPRVLSAEEFNSKRKCHGARRFYFNELIIGDKTYFTHATLRELRGLVGRDICLSLEIDDLPEIKPIEPEEDNNLFGLCLILIVCFFFMGLFLSN